jgi:hypothetical protein
MFAVQARQQKKTAALLASTACLLFSSKKERGGVSHFFCMTRPKKRATHSRTLFADNKKKKVGLSHLCRQSIPIASQSWSSIWRSCLLSPHRCFFFLLLYFLFYFEQAFSSRSVAFFFFFFPRWTSLIH